MSEGQEEIKNIVKVEDAGPCKKKVSVEIPSEKVKNAIDDQYNSLRKEAVVPGFRKGRAPRRLLEKKFGKEASEQVKLQLIGQASQEALEENEIDSLRDPDIKHEEIELPEDGPLKFEFEVEVRPEFDLPELEGIAVEKAVHEVSDDQVDSELEQLRKYSGVWTPREEGAKVEADDQVIADVALDVEGVEEEEKLDNSEIHVRESGFVGPVPVEELDKLLIGAKIGDKKETTVEVPETFFREEYRGKKVDIKIEIKDIKYLKLAELSEEFLGRFGVESEDELKERIGDSLQDRLEQQSRQEMTEQVYKYLLDNTEFDLPTDIVAEQAASLLQRQYINMLQRGMQKEQVDEQMQQLQAASEDQAKEQLKTLFIMDKIAKKFEVEITQEEVNGHIARLAIQQGMRPERMRENMAKQGILGQLGMQIREGKCIDKLLEKAEIKEVKPDDKEEESKGGKKKKTTKKKTTKKSSSDSDEDNEKKKATKKSTKKTSKKKTDK